MNQLNEFRKLLVTKQPVCPVCGVKTKTFLIELHMTLQHHLFKDEIIEILKNPKVLKEAKYDFLHE